MLERTIQAYWFDLVYLGRCEGRRLTFSSGRNTFLFLYTKKGAYYTSHFVCSACFNVPGNHIIDTIRIFQVTPVWI